jgi:hypothetical protein
MSERGPRVFIVSAPKKIIFTSRNIQIVVYIMVYNLEIYYLKESYVKVFDYFQVDVDHATDESPGMGDHTHDKDDTIKKSEIFII